MSKNDSVKATILGEVLLPAAGAPWFGDTGVNSLGNPEVSFSIPAGKTLDAFAEG